MRRGFTLLELVMSIAVSAILLMGMSASISIASRAVGDGSDRIGQTLQTSDILNELASDISSAEDLLERTSDSVTVKVADRDGDGQSETLKYWWTGPTDARLMRQVNDGSAVALAEDVQQFALTYGMTTVLPDDDGNGDGNGNGNGNGNCNGNGNGNCNDDEDDEDDSNNGNGNGNGSGNGNGNK